MKPSDCAHCWHVKSSTTTGGSKRGFDTMFCCFCGKVMRRKWEWVRDPHHGTYADILMRMDGKSLEPVE